MNTIAIDLSSGALLVGATVIAPKSIDEFRQTVLGLGLSIREMVPNAGFITFGMSGTWCGETFGINITYHDGVLQPVWLAWAGGIKSKKGYETTEVELVADKNRLSKLLSKYFKKDPDIQEHTHDVFEFDWGRVSVAASLKSTLVSVGLRWSLSLGGSAQLKN